MDFYYSHESLDFEIRKRGLYKAVALFLTELFKKNPETDKILSNYIVFLINNGKYHLLYPVLLALFYLFSLNEESFDDLKEFLNEKIKNKEFMEKIIDDIKRLTIPVKKDFFLFNLEKAELFDFDFFKAAEVSREKIFYETQYEIENTGNYPKILILNLPWRQEHRAGVRSGSRWPFTMKMRENENILKPPNYVPFPFFLAYTVSLLKKNGFFTLMIDAIAEGVSDNYLFKRIEDFSPDLILLETATASLSNDLGYIIKIKKILPNVKIIVAGSHVTFFGEQFLKEHPFVDGIIRGEFEEAFNSIALYYKKYNSFENAKIKGFLYLNEQHNTEGSLEKTDTVKIESLPFPERLTLPVYNYKDMFAGMVFPMLQIHSSRGCPFGCIFCVWPQVFYSSNRYRTRNPVNVVDEIEEAINFYGFKSFYFDDDTFNIGKDRILSICSEIRKRGLEKIPWAVMARADTFDFETLKAMKDAGLVSIKFGVESGVQRLLDSCGKSLNLEKVKEAVKWCKELSVKYHLTFTFGLPGETEETIKETIDFALNLNPDTCQFSLTTPFPGTKYFEYLKDKGLLLTEDWDKYDGARFTVLKGENLSAEELEQAVVEAKKIWSEFKNVNGSC